MVNKLHHITARLLRSSSLYCTLRGEGLVRVMNAPNTTNNPKRLRIIGIGIMIEAILLLPLGQCVIKRKASFASLSKAQHCESHKVLIMILGKLKQL